MTLLRLADYGVFNPVVMLRKLADMLEGGEIVATHVVVIAYDKRANTVGTYASGCNDLEAIAVLRLGDAAMTQREG